MSKPKCLVANDKGVQKDKKGEASVIKTLLAKMRNCLPLFIMTVIHIESLLLGNYHYENDSN